MQKLKVVGSFKDEYEMFSNFYPVDINFENIIFPSVEHAYQASKTLNITCRIEISKIPANAAGKAKRLGNNKKKCPLRKDWDVLKIAYMKKFLIQKFSIYEFRQLLLSTGTALIIEGNYWHDNYWGDCYCSKCKNIKGLNNLGRLLMKKREGMLSLKKY